MKQAGDINCLRPVSLRLSGSEMLYEAVTNDIRVTVEPAFLDAQSDPDNDRYVWSYTIGIENQGGRTVQLLNRHWMITNALGVTEEVRGPGVVGEQPVLKPGERFDYTSGAPLTTPSGFMRGAYEMVDEAGERFSIDIPAFSLDCPNQPIRLN